MSTSLALPIIILVLLGMLIIALLAAGITGLLSRLDGATAPRALLQAGTAFSSTLLVLAAVLAVGVDMLK
ncbi:hypothetical protein ACIRU8_28050 [Streptomyces sp. NPDC101175]|uniref:hypothetical protein n=1 Tax=Streptomyces sp. NPDC101175 TaxID=3366123 RepID=UPI003839A3A4